MTFNLLFKIFTVLIVLTGFGCGKSSNYSLRDLPQEQATTYTIFAALSKDPSPTDPDAYRVMAASSLTLDQNSVQFCLSTLEKCTNDLTQTKVQGVAMVVDGVKAFVTKSFVKILNNTHVTIMAKDTSGIARNQTIKITTDTATQP